ncbi:nucleotide pyrophosphatase/phosphodiesterase family protein [Verrucomicrobiota bacterium]
MKDSKKKRLLVVQVAALGFDFLKTFHGAQWKGLEFKPMDSVFPALTCPVQAAFRTASPPSEHGMVANGVFQKNLLKPMFWEQSSLLVDGARIWQKFRDNEKKVAMLFWQQSMGEYVDYLLTPAPIHKHHGGMIQDCYSKPAGLYQELCSVLGSPFKLRDYWGPMASTKASDWIARATCSVLGKSDQAPDLCLTYLPGLDYDLQRYGPDHEKSRKALGEVIKQLDMLRETAEANGYDILVFGDYAIGNCSEAVFPNRLLRDAGFLNVRDVKGRLYPDIFESRAFAMTDHEIAHVYLSDPDDEQAVRSMFSGTKEIAEVLGKVEQIRKGIDHYNSGNLVLIASEGKWMSYPWWNENETGPEYAGHVDIHNKPGYDPCELFWGWPPGSVSKDTGKVRGSHGRVVSSRRTCWASTCVDTVPANHVELASYIKLWLNEVS